MNLAAAPDISSTSQRSACLPVTVTENPLIAKFSHHLELHWVVLLVSFTAVGGKVVALSAPELIWYRMLVAALSFLFYLRLKKIPFKVRAKDAFRYMAVGLVVGLHWICFFGAIKLSNVSVTLGVMSTTTLFTSFLEPLVFRKRPSVLNVLFALVVIAGLYLIFQFESRYLSGGMVALVAAMAAAAFVVFNKKFVQTERPSVISFYEMIGGFLGISFFLLFNPARENLGTIPSAWDILFVLFLGIACTAYAFTMFVSLTKWLSAYYVVLAANMEPVYGILLALLFFGQSEMMTPGFYAGALIIFASVLIYPFLERRISIDPR